MVLLQDLKVGSMVLLDVERGKDRFFLSSKIQDTIDDGVVVYAPVEEGEMFSFKLGDELYVRTDQKHGLLRWRCNSFKVKPLNGLWLLSLTAKDKGVSYNRRDAFRVNVGINTKFRADTSELFDMVINDVSYTGVGFSTNKRMELGEVLGFSLSDDTGGIPLTVKVVRSDTSNVGENGDDSMWYEYGAEILGMENSRLSRYVTTRQREELRSRRLLR